jgi:hypothetical protein
MVRAFAWTSRQLELRNLESRGRDDPENLDTQGKRGTGLSRLGRQARTAMRETPYSPFLGRFIFSWPRAGAVLALAGTGSL